MAGFFLFPGGCYSWTSPGEPRSRLGPQGPTPKGLGLDGGEVRRHCVAAMGTGIGEDRGGIEVEVSVSFRDAWSRLKCAGWLPQDRVFGRERSAGLRTSVARAPPGGHRILIDWARGA